MSTTELLPRVEHLARQIADDIQAQGLRPDSPYLTAEEVAKQHGVHPRMAHRAMNLLATRNVLIRRRGAGTVIGPSVVSTKAGGVVHVLVGLRRFERGGAESSFPASLLMATQKSIPGASLQFNILPDSSDSTAAMDALAVSLESNTLRGVILWGCGREVQEYILSLKIPAVVFGGTFATTSSLTSVDGDHGQMGRLLAEHLISRGHQRIAVLMHETWLPGDNLFFEAIGDVISKAGGTCIVRSLPLDASAVKSEAESLTEDDSTVTAVICRTQRRFALLKSALSELDVTNKSLRRRDIEVVFDDTDYRGALDAAYACIADSVFDQSEKVVQQLDTPPQSAPIRLAVRLVQPVVNS